MINRTNWPNLTDSEKLDRIATAIDDLDQRFTQVSTWVERGANFVAGQVAEAKDAIIGKLDEEG